MEFLAQNLKTIRKKAEPKLTQERVAEVLGISPSSYGAYEEGRAEPKLDGLVKLAELFDVAVEDLMLKDLSAEPSEHPSRKSAEVKVLVATVDSQQRDNIELVPQKAAAGYTKGYADVDYISQLPVFQVPFLSKRKKYRAFVLSGDSMLPIRDGAVVIGEYVEDWRSVKDETPCIVVTSSDGIVFKKVYNYLKTRHALLLTSTNPLFKPYIMPADEVLEVWKFAGYFEERFPE
jgi:transcriptional regulator with XRE-family HTH domain